MKRERSGFPCDRSIYLTATTGIVHAFAEVAHSYPQTHTYLPFDKCQCVCFSANFQTINHGGSKLLNSTAQAAYYLTTPCEPGEPEHPNL